MRVQDEFGIAGYAKARVCLSTGVCICPLIPYVGLPCLVRTAMTLLIYPPRRKALLTTSDPEDAMQIMARPVHLPADDLIFRNAKWKINDEDLKRERGRMTKVLADASRKKAVASMGRGGAGRGISLPRA